MLFDPPARRGQQGLGHPVISHLYGADTGARVRVLVVLPPPFSGSSRPTHPGFDFPHPGLADLAGSPAFGAEPGPVEGPGVDDETVPIRPPASTPQEGGRRLPRIPARTPAAAAMCRRMGVRSGPVGENRVDRLRRVMGHDRAQRLVDAGPLGGADRVTDLLPLLRGGLHVPGESAAECEQVVRELGGARLVAGGRVVDLGAVRGVAGHVETVLF
ncbi:hypothetical protein UN64_19965, partial [Fictibacillus arsenicus]